MSTSRSGPTLLVFTRGAERERAHRRLLPERLDQVELALHRQCLETALEAGRRAGCRLVVSSPTPLPLPEDVQALPQSGAHFGERLRRALDAVQAEGPCPVLVVGTDAPGLDTGHLLESLARLHRDPESVVIGPSTDGGFYLLGTARRLDRELAQIPWCRDDTRSSLLAEIRRSGRHSSLLASLTDLDRAPDLSRWLKKMRARRTTAAWAAEWRSLLLFLRRAMADLNRQIVPASIGLPRLRAVAVRSGRAPPCES